jgi:hypothetical protein
MKIIIKEPGCSPRRIVVPNDLKTLQNFVDGYIETVTFEHDWTVICNENGKLINLPFNCKIYGASFYGTILFVGIKGEDFTDCPLKIEDLKDLYEVK